MGLFQPKLYLSLISSYYSIRENFVHMILGMAAALRRQIFAKSQFYITIRNYFLTARIVMNNKSAVLDDSLSKNPFYDKYASKISALQQ